MLHWFYRIILVLWNLISWCVHEFFLIERICFFFFLFFLFVYTQRLSGCVLPRPLPPCPPSTRTFTFYFHWVKIGGNFCDGVILLLRAGLIFLSVRKISSSSEEHIYKGCFDQHTVTTTSLTPPVDRRDNTAANTEEDMVSIRATVMVITILTVCVLVTHTDSSAGMHQVSSLVSPSIFIFFL